MSDMIYSADPGLLIGFHGCEQALRQSIVSGYKSLKPSNNPWDWLGDGIYLWQNNYDRAWHYANNRPGKLKIKKPAVIGAIFSLGNCLDLTDKKYLGIVRKAYEIYASTFILKHSFIPTNRNPSNLPGSKDKIIRNLDCAVIKKVHEIFHVNNRPPFDSVRALFPEGNELYEGAGFLDRTHIQVAIRNPNMIKGYFVPRKEIRWPGTPLALPSPLTPPPSP